METTRIVLPTPTPQQKKFLDLTNSEQLYGGAKGGGKTFVGCLKAIMLSTLIPGNRGMICRLNWPQLRDSTLETFKTVCPPEIREWSASNREHTIRTIDGSKTSTILWRSMGDPDDFEKAKGTELGWLWIDEPTEVPLETYLMLRAQLRWKIAGGATFPPYMSFLTSNPEPGWVKDRFITNMVKGGVFIPALPTDNPHLPPNLVQDLREQHPQIWVEKYLNGSWEVGEGSLFPELGDIHVLENIDHTGMKMLGCIDHATTGITCYLQMGVDKDENLYVLEEYYKKDRLISEHAAAMKFLMEKYGGNDYTLIDPSTEAKTIQGNYDLYSVQDEYRRNGILARAARRSSIAIGIEVLQELVHPLPGRRHPRSQQPPSPRLFIQRSKAPNFWRELSELRSEVDPETGRIKYIGSDHAVDCCRYIAMSRPGAAKRSPQADNYVLQPNEPLANIARTSFARWDKKFGQQNTADTWFPRPN